MASALLALLQIAEVVERGVAAVENHDPDIEPFHCNLAPCYRSLKEGGSLKSMDDQLKIIIAGTTNKLGKLVAQEAQKTGKLPEWNAIVEDMQSNTLLEPTGDDVSKTDKLAKDDMNYFNFDGGSPSKAVVKEVYSWFATLINDEDVLQDTLMNTDTMGAVVAEIGARIKDLSTFSDLHTLQESDVMDIGVVRYPDVDHPYFKVYRIQLTAWADFTETLLHKEDKNGITGVFTCAHKYQPRASVISSLSETTKKKALEEAEEYFC